MQEIGETSLAIIEEDNKAIQDIVAANKHRTDAYWIVLAAKPMKNNIHGKPVLAKCLKAYSTRPPAMVGAIIGEVNNAKGEIRWEINMPDFPINQNELIALGARPGMETVVETTTMPWAYQHM